MVDRQKHGGKREGAGRPKGSLNRRSIEAIEDVAREYPNWSPLKHLARVANDENLDQEIRLDAAKAAAPYVHPKPRTIELDPDALVELEERIAGARADALARKGFHPLSDLADRMERMRRAADRASADPVQSVEAAPTPEPVNVEPVPEPEPDPAPVPVATPAPRAPYAPILPPATWPDAMAVALVNYDPMKD